MLGAAAAAAGTRLGGPGHCGLVTATATVTPAPSESGQSRLTGESHCQWHRDRVAGNSDLESDSADTVTVPRLPSL